MKHKLYNKLSQEVGEYDDVSKVYMSIRDSRKGEIFFKKHWFDNRYINTPIAIDVDILNKLIKGGCERIDILIIGVKEHSFIVSYQPKWIKDNGKLINYDLARQGRNVTHFNNQLVFGIEDGLIGGPEQQKL